MWQIFVDTGGTFTDALAISPGGEIRRAKVLSSGVLRARIAGLAATSAREGIHVRLEKPWTGCDDLPAGWDAWSGGGRLGAVTGYLARDAVLSIAPAAHPPPPVGAIVEVRCPDPAPILAARLLTATPARRALPPIAMRLATTRGTNAFLTGEYPPVALFVTEGLADLLDIGTQQRPDLFALNIRKPPPIHAAAVEVRERLQADGRVLRPVDVDRLQHGARSLLDRGIRTAAVALLHADVNPAHEELVARELARMGFEVVVTSSGAAPFIKLLPRAQTTLVEAALSRIVSDYVRSISLALGDDGRLDLLTSGGGLAPASEYRARQSLLSGPAGGVVGAGAAAQAAGEHEIVAFDMGGTSTDVSRWAGRIERVYEHTVGDVTLVSPAADIHTVAAGGGSICSFGGRALIVGPGSAGAEPGPACYGRGGPLTLTDVQLLCGRIDLERFGIPLDSSAASGALQRVCGSVADPAALLDGFLEVAAERIAGAIRVVSSRRGHDPARASLLAFGGAGGQIACLVAERLGISRVLVPPDAGLLSARGLAAAAYEHIERRQMLCPLDDHGIAQTARELGDAAASRLADTLRSAGRGADAIERSITAGMRLRGQETALLIEIEPPASAVEAFDREYRRIYGYAPGGGEIELVWLAATARGGSDRLAGPRTVAPTRPGPDRAAPIRHRAIRSRGREHQAPIIERDLLEPGRTITGPALIVESHCTTVVEAGWVASVHEDGSLRLDVVSRDHAHRAAPEAEVELVTSRVESIARAMGEALQRTSYSVNVKERLDYSCAVLDAGGRLVACAPHVPVHLGSLGVCVRAVLARRPLRPGDVVATNHPACGGSHLPDVTVIAGAFDDRGRPVGYLAARAHHAEIGGIRPGSMPPSARRLIEEGAVIPPLLVVEAGSERFDELRQRLTRPPHPTRDLRANLEDIRAAIAACARGVHEIEALARAAAARSGGFAALLEAVQDRSAAGARDALAALGRIDVDLSDALDDGAPLRIRVRSDGAAIEFDFTGSSAVHAGNLNATPAIVNSCLVYVMRLLVGHTTAGSSRGDLPLNEGLMRPERVVLPPGMLNPPFDPDADPAMQPAVVGGNVETSQRLVNLLIRGLNLAAESQGTMNNLIFGDGSPAGAGPSASAGVSYYETICGGAGAGPGFAGASAVHTHMTNTRITDPEILERRYPVRLERFAIRQGSGGLGQFRGGDGVERVIRFLAPMDVSVLTQRRVTGPRGAAGGGDGMPGAQWIERADGSRRDLAPIDGCRVDAGEAIVIQTPGGGAWGSPAV